MVSYIRGTIADTNPVDRAYENEFTHLFLCFCSHVCIIKNKKLNLPNIFLFLLKEPDLRDLFKKLCDIDSDYDVLKSFLEYDPTLHRSKYIRNFLQDNPTLKLK